LKTQKIDRSKQSQNLLIIKSKNFVALVFRSKNWLP